MNNKSLGVHIASYISHILMSCLSISSTYNKYSSYHSIKVKKERMTAMCSCPQRGYLFFFCYGSCLTYWEDKDRFVLCMVDNGSS